ncbi:MAG TPA: bacteriohemerythrin [candidate division Zixibacteria bacterium]|nr:bacteriohemerythrin [candidate division Zixibacteria bacterium]
MDVRTNAFRWTQQYAVNVAELDRQHQWLFATIDEFNNALSAGQGAAVTHSALQKLLQYAQTHFAAEETLMREHHFPGLEQHKLEHEKFVKDVLRFIEEFKSKKPNVPASLLSFLEHWLKHHIMVTDKAYSSYLNERGVY